MMKKENNKNRSIPLQGIITNWIFISTYDQRGEGERERERERVSMWARALTFGQKRTSRVSSTLHFDVAASTATSSMLQD
jgi:hypothetical protein